MRRPGVYLGLVIAALFAIAIGVQANLSPNTFQLRHVYAFFASVSELVIIVFAAKLIGDEFSYRTSTFLFTNFFSRKQILLAKLVSLIALALLFGVASNLVALGVGLFIGGEGVIESWASGFGRVTLIYVLHAFCVGSFALLVSVLSMNTVAPIIATIIAFWASSSVIGMVAMKYEALAEFVRYIGFYTASTALNTQTYGMPEVTGLLLTGGILIAGAVILLEKKDLR